MGAVRAEVYGTRNVGTIRNLAGVVIAVGSAVGPAVLGLAFDFGWAVETTCWAPLAIGLAAAIAAAFAAAAARPPRRTRTANPDFSHRHGLESIEYC